VAVSVSARTPRLTELTNRHIRMNQSERVVDEKYQDPYEVKRLELIRKLLPRGANGAALEFGCGSGFVSAMLGSAGWQVTGVDLDPDNVEDARKRVKEAIHGDALTVARSIKERSFGLITIMELIEHLDEADRPALLAETRRLTAPTGRLILTTPNRMSPNGLTGYYIGEKMLGRRYRAWDHTHQRIYSSFEILAELRRCGWIPETIVGYHYKGRISLPLESSSTFPLNRFGFNIMMRCQPA
jgi:2-polyprenyl-3-methyl-5-hydroxy-6-metoxy-1,4-benzoquinol methylase